MATYLLTWNASRSELEWAAKNAATFKTDSVVRFRWACGNTKRIQQGDRLFLLRQSLEPRGLIAIGYVERSPYEDVHWDEDRKKKGERALFVFAAWEYFSSDPVIPREHLNHDPFNAVYWNTQKSGITISDDIGDILERQFRDAISQEVVYLPNEVQEGARYPEGATRRVTVNAYERNPEARRRCIEHHGTICCVCKTDLGQVYGTVADGRIHVHHLRPLSQIGKSYTVDAIKDLKPVCPNCHMVIHLRDPPYSIDEVRNLIAVTSSR